MTFSLSAKNIGQRGCWVVALVRKPDTEWTLSKLNLNDYIDNNDGEFDVTMSRWFNSTKEWSWRLEGTTLFAQLRTNAGWYANETSITHHLVVKNKEGSLVFQKLLVDFCPTIPRRIH